MFFVIQLFFHAVQVVDGGDHDVNARVSGQTVDLGVEQRVVDVVIPTCATVKR
jgi:hypothetical protein